MDAIINPVSGANVQFPLPIKKAATDTSSAIIPVQTVAAQPAVAPAASDASSALQYENAVRKAEISFKNVYALGDQQFSIFKDATGKYITRYVSLRDGKVTYTPSPTLVKQLDLGGGNSVPAHIAISA